MQYVQVQLYKNLIFLKLYHLHSHQQCMRVLVASHPRQHLVFLLLLIVAILVVLIFISLVSNNIEHSFPFFKHGQPQGLSFGSFSTLSLELDLVQGVAVVLWFFRFSQLGLKKWIKKFKDAL